VELYTEGTRRTRPPHQTWEDFGRHRTTAGITRVADVTGLDRIGIPVYNAMRPNSRSLSVSQGKGVTAEAARVSALMESLEYWHAEHIDLPLRYESYARLRTLLPVMDVTQLPLRGSLASPSGVDTPARATLRPVEPMLWLEGVDLLTDDPVWVPYETVTYNRVGLDYAATTFRVSSNGLASGNTLDEAVLHGLYELVERDALTLWWAPRVPPWHQSLVDAATVSDLTCRRLLALLDAADVDVLIWDVSSELGISVYQVCIFERHEQPDWRAFGPCWGYGSHLDPRTALSRALTEAAQSRVTVMASSRDDNLAAQYSSQHAAPFDRAVRELAAAFAGGRDFAERPVRTGATLQEDLALVLAALRAAQMTTCVRVDLTKPELGVPVVKMIVPELEFFSLQPGFRPGRRAARARAADGGIDG
jgi:YcaO-like protein with predicted kinase domain